MKEPQYRRGSRRIRPFVERAKVRHRACSRPLQRVLTDFAADVPFAQVMDKLVEHYGVLLNESSIRRITEGHAQRILGDARPDPAWPEEAGCEVVVGQMDGGMVPIVEPEPAQEDRRKGKRLFWKEAKICLAHAQGSEAMKYGGTLQGDVEKAGRQLFHCATMAGFGRNTQLHAVGDGAEWIAAQVESQFGAQGHYLVDFYHVCDYLSAAAQAIHSDEAAASAWMASQKECLKSGRATEVIHALQGHLEPVAAGEAETPVRHCHRYLSHRVDQLDYRGALAAGLPIGSGRIESAHRYLVQSRLKRAGAWWRAHNAEAMLALRVHRANGLWKDYWANLAHPAGTAETTSV